LIDEVRFGGGLLGHLNKGGTFDVKQTMVSPGYWELTVLNVQMNGKALFFKTISVKEKYFRTEFKRVPDDLTVAEAAEMLRKEVASQRTNRP
jgi:Tfp pilus assembly PilM family ATPase